MQAILDEHLLERAKDYADMSFEATCHFLSNYLPVNSPSCACAIISEADLNRLRNLACHLYNRYSAVMQLYTHYAALPAEHGNVIPLHPH